MDGHKKLLLSACLFACLSVWYFSEKWVVRYAQSTQNKKSNLLILHIFAIYPEKRGDDVDFLPADKRKSFLRVDSITLGVRSQECCTQSNKFAISVQ